MDDKDVRHHSDQNSEHHSDDEHHIVAIPLYLMVFGVLVVGTILTVAVAFIDLDHIFPGANTLVALSIAFFKMVRSHLHDSMRSPGRTPRCLARPANFHR
jgi:cytochrome c oxidase subunit IV